VLSYNLGAMEWRASLSLTALQMLKAHGSHPGNHVGGAFSVGFTEHQFAEKRLPTIDELELPIAPNTPVFFCM